MRIELFIRMANSLAANLEVFKNHEATKCTTKQKQHFDEAISHLHQVRVSLSRAIAVVLEQSSSDHDTNTPR